MPDRLTARIDQLGKEWAAGCRDAERALTRKLAQGYTRERGLAWLYRRQTGLPASDEAAIRRFVCDWDYRQATAWLIRALRTEVKMKSEGYVSANPAAFRQALFGEILRARAIRQQMAAE